MPAADADLFSFDAVEARTTELPFPPVKKSHILHCSCHFWYPMYRSFTPKARLVPVTPAFIDYLKADGIFLPPDEAGDHQADCSDSDSGLFASDGEGQSEDEDEDEAADPSLEWRGVHESIKFAIRDLGGRVAPKLNWSAPQDATWISATNNMECQTPNDVYMLLKASDFVTHDLEHAFDGCIDDDQPTPRRNSRDGQPTYSGESTSASDNTRVPYTLLLRKYFAFNPSVSFRCFVRRRHLLAVCQRDPNYYDFLFPMRFSLMQRIQDFFDRKLKGTFPDENFVFDLYIPAPHQRVWLVDVNPWAPRTDPLLFSWLELLQMLEPSEEDDSVDLEGVFCRLNPNRGVPRGDLISQHQSHPDDENFNNGGSADEEISQPELRLIGKNDPEARILNSPQYSAQKLPKDVVDASQGGVGMLREFVDQWKEIFDNPAQGHI